jgi:subfamily B ATP-binding cassette protein MsbA
MRQLVRDYLRSYFRTMIFAALFMVVAAGMTGALAKMMEPVIDEVFQSKQQGRLIPVAMLVFIVFALRGVTTYAHNILMNRVGQGIVADIQKKLSAHLIRADLSYLHNHAAGHLISNMISDVNVMRTAIGETMVGMIRSSLTVVFLVSVMFWQNWRMAAAAFVVLPLAGLLLGRIGRFLRAISNHTQQEMGEFAATLNQTFQGARQVKAYGMEGYEADRLGQAIDRLYHLAQRGFRVSAFSVPIGEVLSGLAIVMVVLYGGNLVMTGKSTAGEIFSFITAFLLAYEPMKKLGKMAGMVQTGLGAAERVLNILDIQPRIKEKPDAPNLIATSPTINFENVRFHYDDGKVALDGLTLTVPSGAKVALVGPSGAGKSTILNLIPRFYDVASGRVVIDGQDIRDVTITSLRQNIALVSQEVAIFDDSIAANIRYGSLDADDATVIEAARQAAAHDFILALPDGYQTRVGENGVKLSGGQRQRLAIARAMLRNAPILLLDEATSALDADSERFVQEALARLQAGKTTLVIAHRLSTIVDADLIYVIDKGQVAEFGNHKDLLLRDGVYRRLYGLNVAWSAG